MVKTSQTILAVDQGIPVIDMSQERSQVSTQIVKACETLGFFKIVNHGVDQDLISTVEKESFKFFAKPVHEKNLIGAVNQPFGYGVKNIGPNGDIGAIEYLLLHANDTEFLKKLSFGTAVNSYIKAIKQLTCEILDLTAEGLGVPPNTFTKLIKAVDSDCYLRMNHYPPLNKLLSDASAPHTSIGFGEHTDPQILTVLRSNGVGGLQVSNSDGSWVPVFPDPSAFSINVGDLLQVMTNGRFKSLKHRAIAPGGESRLSTAYFAGPPLEEKIGPIPAIITAENERKRYQTFTWGDYKNMTYSLRLQESRLDMFRTM